MDGPECSGASEVSFGVCFLPFSSGSDGLFNFISLPFKSN